MAYHNETCGCPECGNYGQVYNPGAIHNQSCGCEACGNYPQTSFVGNGAAPSSPEVEVAAVPAVRVLPMNPSEFPGQTVEEVTSQFFLHQLPSPSRHGRYYYRTSGLSAEPGTVVLFQFDN